MFFLVKVAFRNIFRHKKRTLITIITISIGIFYFIFLEGLLQAFNSQSVDNLIRYDTGHLKIFRQGYWPERNRTPLDYSFDYVPVLENIKNVRTVKGAVPRLYFPGRIYDGRAELPVFVTAIDTSLDEDVFSLRDAIAVGRYIHLENDVLIGSKLAKLFNAGIGSPLIIEFRDIKGIYDALSCQVAGIIDTNHPDIDNSAVYISLDYIEKLTSLENKCTEIAIRLSSSKDIGQRSEEILARLNSSGFTSMQTATYIKQSEDFMSLKNTKNTGTVIIMSVLLLIIIVGIANTMIMAVYERFREIGTLMALGMTDIQIRMLFLLEAIIISLFGSIAGNMLGLGFMIPFSIYGFNIGKVYGDMDIGYIVKDYVYGSIRPEIFLFSFLISVTIAVFAAYIPAKKASKLKPVEALRHY